MFRRGKREGEVSLQTAKLVLPKLYRLAVDERRTLITGLVALTLGSGVNLLFPALVRKFLKGELGLSLEQDLPLVASLLLLLFGFQASCFYIRHLAFLSAGLRAVAKLREDLFARILHREIAFFDRSKSAELVTRLTSDCQLVQSAVSTNISVLLRYSIQVIGGLVLMALISLKLTALILLTVPLIVLGTKRWGKRLQSAARTLQDALSRVGVLASERFAGIRIVRIFSTEERELSLFHSAITDSLQAGVERAKVAAVFSSVMVFIVHSAIALIFFVGARMVLTKELEMGDLVAFLLYCAIVSASFGFLVGVIDELLGAIGGASRVFELIEASPRQEVNQAPVRYDETGAHFAFQDVSFGYEGGTDTLRRLSFEVKPGETIALVGPSGAGKTTVLSLLSRFYEPSSGNLLYQGVPLREIPPEVYERDIALVPQDPILFSTSLRENLRYSRLDASEEELREAIRMAQLEELVARLPAGLETEIGERGVKLSGGERQRLSIARAILKNPKLLMLDEPTSALDSQNEHLVQEALERVMKGRTVIIVAHRLSTVQHADRILVLQGGALVETGSHNALLAQNGLYASLVRYQLL